MPERSRPSPAEVLPPFTWARSWLLSPPRRKLDALVIVLAVLGVIGWFDYVAGYWVSLQLLYLMPIVLSVAWLGWRAGCVTAILSVLFRLTGDAAAGIFDHVDLITVFWNRLAEAAISCIIVLVLHSLFSLQRELEERVRQRTASLEQANAARHQLQDQLFAAGERERSAIGHDLHDGLGQHLAATSIAANLLATRLAAAGQPTAAAAETIRRLLQEAITKTRQIARGLLLSAVDPDALVPELEELAESVRREHGITSHFTVRGALRGVDVTVTSHLFYVAREATRNAVHHASARRIELDLSIDERALTLTITDDGRGLPPESDDRPGLGLRVMRHRSELIGATFALERPVDGGTRVRCQLPLPPPDSSSPFP